MDISDILSEDVILTNLASDSKRHLLEQVSSFIADKYRLDKSVIFEALLERENLGSTGYGNGVAFPHARINGLDKVITTFVRLDVPVEYDAVDSKAVDLLAFIISPENNGNDYLQTLAVFSRLLKNEDVCSAVRGARSVHDIYLALNK